MNGILDDFKNAFRKPNNGLIQIILINIIVFLVLAVLRLVLRWTLGIDPESGFKPEPFYYHDITKNLFLSSHVPTALIKPWTLVTYFFAHEGIFHILWNMLFLYWFGKLIEEYLGNRRLINLYLLGGLAAGISYLLIYNLIPNFKPAIGTPLLGASGAVYAVVVGAATLMPNYTFFMLLLGPVRIKYIAAFFIVSSFVDLSNDANPGGNIAHLGGALLGFFFITQLKKGNDIGKPLTGVAEWLKKLFQPKPKLKVTHRSPVRNGQAPSAPHAIPNQDEIDAILDKISRSGYDSLTKEEKQKLFRASQKNN
jgi:membrane associated rhomboid family serine protease